MFVSLFLPLLGVKSDSKVASDFTAFVSPQNRQLHKDRNTARGVFEAIVRLKDSRFMDIIGPANQLLKNDMFAALVDPVDRGVVNKLPPADFNHRVIVFLTRGLRLPRSGVDMDQMDLTERYTIMVNTAVAMYTRRHFEGIKSTGAFVGDEMSFYRGLSVLKPLIQDQDRTGRKFGKFVMAGSQTDDEFRDEEYKLVRKRVVMAQEKHDNAVGSLDWADFDTSPYMVRELTENTSPPDPERNNLPMKGRAGEAFFNDGVGKGKIRVLPQFQADIERLADTSTSKFIRYSDVRGGDDVQAPDAASERRQLEQVSAQPEGSGQQSRSQDAKQQARAKRRGAPQPQPQQRGSKPPRRRPDQQRAQQTKQQARASRGDAPQQRRSQSGKAQQPAGQSQPRQRPRQQPGSGKQGFVARPPQPGGRPGVGPQSQTQRSQQSQPRHRRTEG